MLSECKMFLDHDGMSFMATEPTSEYGCEGCYYFPQMVQNIDCPRINGNLACVQVDIEVDIIWMRIQ